MSPHAFSGSVPERLNCGGQTAEGSKLVQEALTCNPQRNKRSQSQNVASVSEQMQTDSINQMKEGERRDKMDKYTIRKDGIRKQRNTGSTKNEGYKKYHTRHDGNSLLTKGANKKQPIENDKQEVKKEDGEHARPDSANPRLIIDQVFRGGIKCDKTSEAKELEVFAASQRDATSMAEMEHCLTDKKSSVQTNLAGNRLVPCRAECLSQTKTNYAEEKSEEVGAAVGRTSSGHCAEKARKSRLVTPRPAKDIILHNKAMVSNMAAGKPNILSSEMNAVGNKAAVALRQRFLDKEQIENHFTIKADESMCAEMEIVSVAAASFPIDRINNELTPTPVNHHIVYDKSLFTICADCSRESVESEQTDKDHLRDFRAVNVRCRTLSSESQTDDIAVGSNGQNLEDEERTKLNTLAETDGNSNGCNVVSSSASSESFKDQQQRGVQNAANTQEKDVFSNQDVLSCAGVSESPSFENKMKTAVVDCPVPVTEAASYSIVQQDEPFESQNENKTPKPSAASTSVPSEMWKDWTDMEKTIQSLVKGFMDKQDFMAEVSGISPQILDSVSQWISMLGEMQKKKGGENVSDELQNKQTKDMKNDQRDIVDDALKGSGMNTKLTTKYELTLKDQPQQESLKDPKSLEKSPMGNSPKTEDCLAAVVSEGEMFHLPTLKESPQTYDVSVSSFGSTGQNVQDHQRSYDAESPEEIVSVPSNGPAKSSAAEFGARSVDDAVDGCDVEEGKLVNPIVMRHPNSLLFVDCYFDEPVKTKTVEEEVPNEHREIIAKPQSHLDIVPGDKLKKKRLKRHQGSSLHSQSVSHSSQKVRGHLEMIAGEIAAMAVPEWVVMNLSCGSGGEIIEETTTEESPGPNTEDLEAVSVLPVGDVDSCEEANALTDEEAEREEPAAEVVVKEVRTPPAATSTNRLSRRRRARLGVTKDENKADCKIS